MSFKYLSTSGLEIVNNGKPFVIRGSAKNIISTIDTISKKMDFNGDVMSKCLIFKNSNNQTIEIVAPNIITEDYKFILPVDSGNTNEFFRTNGNQVSSWNIAGVNPVGDEDSIQINGGNNTFIGYSTLIFNGSSLTTNNLIISDKTISSLSSNNITLSPSGNGIIDMTKKIKLQYGTPEAGKILTSDVNGFATWENSTGGDDLIESLVTSSIIPTLSISDFNTLFPLEIDDNFTINLPAPSTDGLSYKFIISKETSINSKILLISSTSDNLYGEIQHVTDSNSVKIDQVTNIPWTNSNFIGEWIKFTALGNQWNVNGYIQKIWVPCTIFSLSSTLEASNAGTNDNFGRAVSISGNTILVGAYKEDSEAADAGAAYIYDLVNNVWSETAILTFSSADVSDWFGFALAIDGPYAIIGAYRSDWEDVDAGAAIVFLQIIPGTWIQTQILVASEALASDLFGFSVAMDGSTCVIGAHGVDTGGSSSGAAYIFTAALGTWTQMEKIVASDPAVNDYFSFSVDISGDYIISGAYGDDDKAWAAGSAYIFKFDSGSYVQQQKLLASDGITNDRFGYSVSISGNYCVIGAYFNGNGKAYIYKNINDTWTEQKIITATVGVAEGFGISVRIDGDYICIGTFGTGPFDPGAAYIFHRNCGGNDNWGQVQKITGNANIDGFGRSVTIQENTATAVIGAEFMSNEGRAYIYKRD